MEAPNPHVAIVCSSGMGHLIPALELGSRLVTLHNLHVTLVIVPFVASAHQTQLVLSACATCSTLFQHIIQLPPVDISNLVQDDDANLTRTRVIMRQAIPALKSTISSLTSPIAALIVDFLGSELLGAATELGIPKKYIFLPSNAWYLALIISLPTLNNAGFKEESIKISGCHPVRPEDVFDPDVELSGRKFREAVMRGMEIPMADGILLNVWEGLEPLSLGALRDPELLGQAIRAPVYPVGPLIRGPKVEVDDSCTELSNWLDTQPRGSVVYVSFGSWGTLSLEQMTELAWGLELSQQKFIWVVRQLPPKTIGRNGNENLSNFLPHGFVTRTQNVGLVVTQWAPQVEILNHPSVGAFLSHCGWNSTLESITNGVPMIAWPLYSEQKLNATLLAEDIGVAVRSKVLPSKGLVGREEINSMIRRVMVDEEGQAIRAKIKKLKDGAEYALTQNGSSHNALAQVAKECEMSMQMLEDRSVRLIQQIKC